MQQTSLSAGRGPLAPRRLAVPEHAPPYDDRPETAFPHIDTGNAQLPRPLTPRSDPVTEPGQAGLPEFAAETSAACDSPAAPAAANSQPRMPAWPGQFAQILAETLAGARPARQLTPWTSEQARRRIRQLGETVTADQRPTVRRIMTSAPAQDVLELTAVVGFGAQVRVLALRLERDPAAGETTAGRPWCCTEIESA